MLFTSICCAYYFSTRHFKTFLVDYHLYNFWAILRLCDFVITVALWCRFFVWQVLSSTSHVWGRHHMFIKTYQIHFKYDEDNCRFKVLRSNLVDKYLDIFKKHLKNNGIMVIWGGVTLAECSCQTCFDVCS